LRVVVIRVVARGLLGALDGLGERWLQHGRRDFPRREALLPVIRSARLMQRRRGDDEVVAAQRDALVVGSANRERRALSDDVMTARAAHLHCRARRAVLLLDLVPRLIRFGLVDVEGHEPARRERDADVGAGVLRPPRIDLSGVDSRVVLTAFGDWMLADVLAARHSAGACAIGIRVPNR
jgi:hypothetical protein